MFFYIITVDVTYLTWNNSSFYITSINPINISYNFIRYKPPAAVKNEKVMSFYINTTSAVVNFRVSGFQSNMRYKVYKDSILIGSPVSTSTGHLLFSNDGWGVPPHYIEIYESGGEKIICMQHDMEWIAFLAFLALGFVFWKKGIIFRKNNTTSNNFY